ncbi:MAG: phage tail tape measure protein [Pseudomonadota bacterium]|nr:phage tail tape measure protein [Pseudomonadota bacterium]
MSNSLQLKVVLAAIDKATGPMRKMLDASKGTGKALEATRQHLRKFDEQQRAIAAHRGLESRLSRDGNALLKARKELQAMHAAHAAAEKPTKALTNAMDRQLGRVKKLAEAQKDLRSRLGASKAKLAETGIAVGKLAQHERDLAASTQRATKALEKQQARLNLSKGLQAAGNSMARGGMLMSAHGVGAYAAGRTGMQQTSALMQPGIALQATMRDIAITGDFSRQQEAALTAQIRADALRFNQTSDAIALGLQELVANGITAEADLAHYSNVLGKASVASGAEIEDLSSLIVSLQRNLGMGKDEIAGAFDALAYSGKQGSFELRDMAKWFPQLAPMMAGLGVTGRDAVDQLGSALQIARLGAGSSDEAANNLKNFLSKVVSADTLKSFDKAGINLKKRLMELQAKGVNPLQGSLQLITEYMGKKSPQAMGQLRTAMALKGDTERQAALEKLASAYALGDLFRDQQAMAFIRPALANAEDMDSIQQGAAGANGVLDADWKARMDTAQMQAQRLQIRLTELKLKAFDVLGPSLNQLSESAGRWLDKLGNWIERNPALASSLLKGAAGFAVLAAALGAILIPLGIVMSVAGHSLKVFGWLAGVNWAPIANGISSAFMPLVNVFRMILPAVLGVSAPVVAAIAAIGIAAVLIWKYWQPIKAFLIGVWDGFMVAMQPVQVALASAFEPLRPVFDWLGNAFGAVVNWVKEFLTPMDATNEQLATAASWGLRVGQAIGAVMGTNLRIIIGVLGVLIRALKFAFNWSPLGIIIRNWGPISPYLSAIWDGIKAAGAALWSALKFAFNWSPLGIIIRNWSTIGPYLATLWDGIKAYAGGAWDYLTGLFSGDREKMISGLQGMWTAINTILAGWPAKMLQAGLDMVQGFIDGIRSKFGGVGEAIAGLGTGAIAGLKLILGIKSPSRVFAALGDDTMAGFRLGLDRSGGDPLASINTLGQHMRTAGAGIALAGAMAGPAVALDARPPLAGSGGAGSGAAGNTYQITVNVSGGAAAQDIGQAVRAEIERLERERSSHRRTARLGDYD